MPSETQPTNPLPSVRATPIPIVPNPDAPSTMSHYSPVVERLATIGWRAVNFASIVGVSSSVISLVQNPFNAILLNLTERGQVFAPASHPRVGMLAAVRALYAGLSSNFAAANTRALWAIGAKKTSNNIAEVTEQGAIEEQAREQGEQQSVIKSSGYLLGLGSIVGFALGDVMVSQKHDSQAKLLSAKIIDDRFNSNTGHNRLQLVRLGFGARFSGGLINYSGLCLVQDWYAHYMPFSSEKTNRFFAGAASGMTAAVFAFPFSYWRDYALLKAAVVEGKLYPMSFIPLVSTSYTQVQHLSVQETLTKAAIIFGKQAPLKMGRSGITFALLSWIGAALGNEPLTKIMERPVAVNPNKGLLDLLGFFSNPKSEIKNPEPESSRPSAQTKP